MVDFALAVVTTVSYLGSWWLWEGLVLVILKSGWSFGDLVVMFLSMEPALGLAS